MTYRSTQEHLLDEIERIDTILDAYDPTGELIDDERPSVRDIEGLATEPRTVPLCVPDRDRHRIEAMADDIERRIQSTEDVTLRLHVLAENFGLSRRHLDVLLLALAPRLDADYHDTFREAHNREMLLKPTVMFVEDLFSTTPEECVAAGALIGSDSPLRRHDLIVMEPSPDEFIGERGRMLAVDDRIVEYLRGYEGVDPALQAAVEEGSRRGVGGALDDLVVERTADATPADLTVDDGLRDRLTALSGPTDGGRRFYWYGAADAEKHRAVAAVCRDERYLQADLEAVVAAGALDRLHREASLLDRPLHLTSASAAVGADEQEEGGDHDPSTSLGAIFDLFDDVEADVFVTGTEPWTPTGGTGTALDAIVEFPYPSIDLRRRFWERHAHELPDDVDPEVLAGTFTLTQGELEAALATARSVSDGELTAEDVYEGCSAQSADDLEDLAQHIEPSSDWDDIELREDTWREIQIVRDHVTHQARIYSEWGFNEQFSRGTGVVALFEGPSGTGKTMAAEIIANDVGMDLYKIDLSSIVSKYIGETEENLEEIFQAAEHSNAILLFDEADAVFGDRAEVSDATDRYANAEVNYLLQRIESYDGVVLLTTNYESNIDDAFQRRIDHTVSFSQPRLSTRRAIWEGILPDRAPTDELDFDFLAEFEFTGGEIKTIGQTAAILAAGDDDAIGMEHVVRAIQLELDKQGTMVDPSKFGEYKDALFSSSPPPETISDDEDETDLLQADRPPETVLRAFFDYLSAGDVKGVHNLYHSNASVSPFPRKKLVAIEQGDLEITSDIERTVEERHRVVLQFEQRLNGNEETIVYELRRDDGNWRVFDFGRPKDTDLVISQ